MPVSNCTAYVALPRICHGTHGAGGRRQRDMMCLEAELVKFYIVAGLSYPAAPFPFPR